METKTETTSFVATVPSSLTIYGAKNIFSHIDLAFKNLKIISKVNSPETVDVHELIDHDANFLQVFLSLNSSPSLLSLSEETIVKYCLHHDDFLKTEKQNVFFYLGDRVVAKVNYHTDGLHVNYYDLHSPIVWKGNKKRFFVVPSR